MFTTKSTVTTNLLGLALALAGALPLAACGAADESAGDVSSTKAGLLDEQSLFYIRAPVDTFGDRAVTLTNGGHVRVDLAAARSLAKHRELAQQLAGAGAALYGATTTTEEFFETSRTVGLIATTRFVVADADVLRAAAPLATPPRPHAGARMDALTVEQRAWFQGFRADMLKKPASHPLGGAARQSDAALWAALLQGKGDVTVTTRVEVPMSRLTRSGATVQAPTIADGDFDYAHTTAHATHGAFTGTPTFEDIAGLDPSTTGGVADGAGGLDHTSATGTAKTVTQFVDGYMIDDSFEWSTRWDFGIGYVKVTAGAWYAAGLRIPVEVTGTLSPSKLGHSGNTADQAADTTTDVSVRVLDASESFYADAGLPESELWDGKELVFTAGAYVNIKASLAGVLDINTTIPAHEGFDFGQNFAPPFNGCGTSCGLDFWIPSETTHTGISLLGIVTGEARIGFNVSGDGHVDLDYEALDDGATVSSMGPDGSHSVHDVSFSTTAKKSFTASISKLAAPGSKKFGYRLSDVDYTWDVALTPGVRGDISIDTWLWSWSTTIGPLWIDVARVDLGSIRLPALDGTRESRKVQKGEKSWTDLQPEYDSNMDVSVQTSTGSVFGTLP